MHIVRSSLLQAHQRLCSESINLLTCCIWQVVRERQGSPVFSQLSTPLLDESEPSVHHAGQAKAGTSDQSQELKRIQVNPVFAGEFAETIPTGQAIVELDAYTSTQAPTQNFQSTNAGYPSPFDEDVCADSSKSQGEGGP